MPIVRPTNRQIRPALRDTLHICGMHKVCKNSLSCTHAMTHLPGHVNCWHGGHQNIKLCSSFRPFESLPKELNTDSKRLVLRDRVRVGRCIPYTYYQENMKDDIHVLTNELGHRQLVGYTDGLYYIGTLHSNRRSSFDNRDDGTFSSVTYTQNYRTITRELPTWLRQATESLRQDRERAQLMEAQRVQQIEAELARIRQQGGD